jgi:hypothetical protein
MLVFVFTTPAAAQTDWAKLDPFYGGEGDLVEHKTFRRDFNRDGTPDRLECTHNLAERGVSILWILSLMDGKTKQTQRIRIYQPSHLARIYTWVPNALPRPTADSIMAFWGRQYNWAWRDRPEEAFQWLLDLAKTPKLYENDLFWAKKAILRYAPTYETDRPARYITRVPDPIFAFLHQLDLASPKTAQKKAVSYWKEQKDAYGGYILYRHWLLGNTYLGEVTLGQGGKAKLWATYNGLHVQTKQGYAWIYLGDPVITREDWNFMERQPMSTFRVTLMGDLVLLNDPYSGSNVVYDLVNNFVVVFKDIVRLVPGRSLFYASKEYVEVLDISKPEYANRPGTLRLKITRGTAIEERELSIQQLRDEFLSKIPR